MRIKGDDGFITVKGKSNASGTSRFEWEKQISSSDAQELLKLCLPNIIDKTRYEIQYHGKLWEIDEFHGLNKGLIVAEIELNAEEEEFQKPIWLGKEVTGEVQYYNSYLSSKPYASW